jgi:hypothetical protein
MEQRSVTATYVAFGVSPNGKPYLSVLSLDQKETIDIQIDDFDVALIAEKTTCYLGDRVRGRK